MGIRATFNMGDVASRLRGCVDVVTNEQVRMLQQLGEKCVEHMRNEHPNDWQDRTGNLRSSVGYMVFVDGVAVHSSSFGQVPAHEPETGLEMNGGAIGQDLCRTIGEEHPTGMCLVVVAGMNYAAYVEAKGRDVIAGAEQLAERELPRMIEELEEDLKDYDKPVI